MLCVPAVRLDVKQEAVRTLPLPETTADAHPAIDAPPSVKLTLPVGARPVTVAVNVTPEPGFDGLSELASVVVVGVPVDVATCTVSAPAAPGVAEITLIDKLVEASTNAGAPASSAASWKFPCVAGVMSRISVSSLPEDLLERIFDADLRACVRIAGRHDEGVEHARRAADIRSSTCGLRWSWES